MSILIWLLTAILVMDCLFLILLVLIQLPKKEAGLGQAFGGGTTDALFGAGAGNVLTKLTKYSTAVFFISTLLISVLNSQQARARSGDPRLKLSMEEKLAAVPKQAATNAAAAATTATTAMTNAVATNNPGAIKLTLPSNSVPAAAAPAANPAK